MNKWYVIRIVAGKEKKAREQIEYEIRVRGITDKVKQIVVPTEKTYYIRNGKKICVEKNFFPGYILIEIEHNIIGELIGIQKTSEFVVGFLGGENPQPLKDSEVDNILSRIDESSQNEQFITVTHKIGEIINIVDGPFKGFTGSVKEIILDKNRLKIDVKIFGRTTSLELDNKQVERIY